MRQITKGQSHSDGKEPEVLAHLHTHNLGYSYLQKSTKGRGKEFVVEIGLPGGKKQPSPADLNNAQLWRRGSSRVKFIIVDEKDGDFVLTDY